MNLLKSISAISFITVISRILGFIRDTLIAIFFGAGIATDAFLIAFRIPNLLRRIFAEGAFLQAFVPILVEYKNQQHGYGEIKLNVTYNFVAYVSGWLTLILAIITLIGIITAPYIIYITAPGFNDLSEKFNLAVSLLRVIFSYIFFISLVSLSGAILNSWNCFYIPALAPTLLNVSMIISMLLLTHYCKPPIMALAWGVLLGGILQFLYQLPYLYKIGMLVLPRISLHDNGSLRVIKLMGSAFIGVFISQISVILNTILVSFLQSGSISWLYYAERLIDFPTGVLGVSLGTILLPSLAKSFSMGDYKKSSHLIDWGLRICFVLSLPCTIAIAILAQPLTISLFQYGTFTAYDTAMTQRALIAYSFGLIGLVVVKVLATCFYSRQNIKTPVLISLITSILNQLMNLVFIGPLNLDHVGLALSIGISACCNALLLYWQLRRQDIYIPLAGWGNFLKKLTLSLINLILVLLFLVNIIPTWDWEQCNMLKRVMRLLFIIITGIISYCLSLFMLGLRLKDFSKLA